MDLLVTVGAVVAIVLSAAALAMVVVDRRMGCQCQREEPLASLTALATVTAGVRARSARRDVNAPRPTVRRGRHVRRVHHHPQSRPVG